MTTLSGMLSTRNNKHVLQPHALSLSSQGKQHWGKPSADAILQALREVSSEGINVVSLKPFHDSMACWRSVWRKEMMQRSSKWLVLCVIQQHGQKYLSLSLSLQLNGKATVKVTSSSTTIHNCHDEKLRSLLKTIITRQLVQI